MARPKKTITLDEEISKQENVVAKSKAKYDADVEAQGSVYKAG